MARAARAARVARGAIGNAMALQVWHTKARAALEGGGVARIGGEWLGAAAAEFCIQVLARRTRPFGRAAGHQHRHRARLLKECVSEGAADRAIAANEEDGDRGAVEGFLLRRRGRRRGRTGPWRRRRLLLLCDWLWRRRCRFRRCCRICGLGRWSSGWCLGCSGTRRLLGRCRLPRGALACGRHAAGMRRPAERGPTHRRAGTPKALQKIERKNLRRNTST